MSFPQKYFCQKFLLGQRNQPSRPFFHGIQPYLPAPTQIEVLPEFLPQRTPSPFQSGRTPQHWLLASPSLFQGYRISPRLDLHTLNAARPPRCCLRSRRSWTSAKFVRTANGSNSELDAEMVRTVKSGRSGAFTNLFSKKSFLISTVSLK
jgi:hypothetical protein